MNFVQARKFARRDQLGLCDVYLAESVDRRTTLAIGWFTLGPRGGKQPRYAVRLGIKDGCACGGCCLFTDAENAMRCFLKNAQ